jgi:putative multiple sugar transport system substrate-binding protein
MKRFSVIVFSVLLVFSLAMCSRSNDAKTGEAKLIGVAMPTRTQSRWVKEGDIIKEQLEAKGYRVDVQFAEDDVQTQISQIENMITSGVDCLVVTPVDNTALNNVLQTAAEQNIPIIAYDRLIMNTDNVSYLVTFDNVLVGENSVKEVLRRLQIDSLTEPVNVEIFTGDSGDQNSYTFYEGVMNILKPYLDSGKVIIPSGQSAFDQISIAGWSQENALKRMENLLSGYYSRGTKLHAIIGPWDGATYAYASALEAAGYVPDSAEWPLTTGQDCEVMAVVNILEGKTTFSQWRDGRVEAEHLLDLIEAVINGTTPQTTKNFDNGVKKVPSFLCQTTIIDKDNAIKELVDGGYYTAQQLGL